MLRAERSKVSVLVQSVRIYSLSAALVPVLIGGAVAFSYHQGEVAWGLMPIVVVCALLFQMGTNVINDYFDFKKGIDQDQPFGGGSGVLTSRLMTPRQFFIEGCVLFGIAILLGFVLIYFRGVPMFLFGLIGLLGGYFYSGGPKGYKYLGLGEVLVFVLMGPLMVIGTYFVLTANYTNSFSLYASLPVGFLVASIMAVNNHRDIAFDAESGGIKTLSMILGFRASKVQYCLLVAAAYLSVVLMAFSGLFSYWTLLVFLSLPVALGNLKTIWESDRGQEERLAPLVPRTAQLHLLFGVLLTCGIVLDTL